MTGRSLILGEFIAYEAGALRLAATDGEGPLEVIVGGMLWEELRLSAPDYCDAEDRREHALGCLEAMARDRRPDVHEGGRRLRLG